MTKRIIPPDPEMHDATHRQRLIPGYSQEAMEKAHVVLIGAGGLGSEIGYGLAKKGVGKLTILDDDEIEFSNLNRQFFFVRDIGKPKGKQLARNLATIATGTTEIIGYSLTFQDARDLGLDLMGDVIVCGVDCTRTVTEVAEFYLGRRPAVFVSLGRKAEAGLVFVQEVGEGKACRGCAPHYYAVPRKMECFAAASVDASKVACGYALLGIDSLLMPRPRTWNYRITYMAGGGEDVFIGPRPNCPICGKDNHKIIPFPKNHLPLQRQA